MLEIQKLQMPADFHLNFVLNLWGDYIVLDF